MARNFSKITNDTFSLADPGKQYLRVIDLFCITFFNHPMPSDHLLEMFINIVVCGLHICCVFHIDPSLNLDKYLAWANQYN